MNVEEFGQCVNFRAIFTSEEIGELFYYTSSFECY